MSCTFCSLHETAQTVCIPGRGAGRIMLVADAPGAREDFRGEALIGPTGDYLERMLRDAGFDPAALYVTYAVKCKPIEMPPEKAHVDACRAHIKAEIAAQKPEAIIACGATALHALTKLSGIMQKRGQSFPLHKDFGYECEVWPTLSPGAVLKTPLYRNGVVADLRRIRDRHKESDPIAWSWWQGQNVTLGQTELGFDIETDYDRVTNTGGSNIIQCAIATRNEVFVALGHQAVHLAKQLVNFPGTVYTLNGWKFDNPKCYALGLYVPQGIDVMALAFLDDETQPLGLEALAVKYLGVRGWKDEREAEPGSDAFAIYNARDARHTLDLATHFNRTLGDSRCGAPRSRIVTDIIAPARIALDACTARGVPLNLDPISEAVEATSAAVALHLERLQELTRNSEFNPNSPKQVALALNLPEGASTAIGVLEGLPKTPLVLELKAYRKAKKRLSTYGLNYQRMATTGDGRVHSEYTQWRTVTMRTSARKAAKDEFEESANIQNLPREYKSFLGGQNADYSAVEFRLAAWCAQEDVILARFAKNPNWDPHRWFAALFYECDEEQVTKAQRQVAKSANFSQLYVGSAQTLQDYAAKMGVELSLAECQKLHRIFHSTYPRFKSWFAEVRQELQENSYVETATGFRRHYGDFRLLGTVQKDAAVREAVNCKVQTLAAHVALLGLSECHQRSLPVCGFIHDSVLFDFAPGEAAGYKSSIVEALTVRPLEILRERFNVNITVPLTVDLSGFD